MEDCCYQNRPSQTSTSSTSSTSPPSSSREYFYFYYYCHSSSLPLPLSFLFFINHQPVNPSSLSSSTSLPPYRFSLPNNKQQSLQLVLRDTDQTVQISPTSFDGDTIESKSLHNFTTSVTTITYDCSFSNDTHVTTFFFIHFNDTVLYSLLCYLLSYILTMDVKPIRKTSRIRDENDPATLAAAIGRRKMMSSAAGTKAVSQRSEQPAKRVALADSTRYETAVAQKVVDQAAKGSLGKSAVRGKPLAVKHSVASVATGTKAHQRPPQRQTSKKSMVHRDQENKAPNQVAAKAAQPRVGSGNVSASQAAHKRPFVYRDEPQPAVALEAKLATVSEKPSSDASSGAPGVKASATEEYEHGGVHLVDEEPPARALPNAVEGVKDNDEIAPGSNLNVTESPTVGTFGDQCQQPADDANERRLVQGGALFPEWNDAARREVSRAHDICSHPSFKDTVLDDGDPSYVADYADEILAYLMELDLNYLAHPHYMANQTELRWDMRSTLIDWLIEVHERFQMVSEVLFNAVNIIDRFLSKKIIPVHQLQLVGITALLIAAKLEEIYPPSMDSFVFMVDDAYSADEIRACEAYMLKTLQWEINSPGPMNFLRYISTADEYQWDIRALAKYFLEASLMDKRFVGTPISYTAAASYYLAMIMLNEGDWNVKHIHYSGYTAEQLKPAIEVLIEMMGLPQIHHPATFNKYSDKKFKRVASFVEKWMCAQFNNIGPFSPSAYDPAHCVSTKNGPSQRDCVI
ncbi:Cyclin-B2-1 [Arthrobotrys entomopaga]|nr:Cyclin-B2-1 [Arthrobotrys entomopaga]